MAHHPFPPPQVVRMCPMASDVKGCRALLILRTRIERLRNFSIIDIRQMRLMLSLFFFRNRCTYIILCILCVTFKDAVCFS